MKIETFQQPNGYWCVMYDGVIDAKTIGYTHEDGVYNRAQSDNQGAVIINSDNPLHNSKGQQYQFDLD